MRAVLGAIGLLALPLGASAQDDDCDYMGPVRPAPTVCNFFFVGAVAGGGGGHFSFEDLNYGMHGAFAGLNGTMRTYNGNLFLGSKVEVVGGSVRGSTFDGTIEVSGHWNAAAVLDTQVGGTFQVANGMAVSPFIFAGPMYVNQNVNYGGTSSSEWMTGITGGAGIDLHFAPKWSLELSVRGYSVGKNFDLFPGTSSSAAQSGVVGEVGVMYQFGSSHW